MIRSIVTPHSNDLHIALPDKYIGKKVEVLVFSYDEPVETPTDNEDIMAQFWGVISEHTTEDMHQHVAQSRAEWERDIGQESMGLWCYCVQFRTFEYLRRRGFICTSGCPAEHPEEHLFKIY